MSISKEQREHLNSVTAWYGYLESDRALMTDYIEAAPRPQDLPGMLRVEGAELIVEGYGYCIKAKPRVVSDASGQLAMEYKFIIKMEEDFIPIRTIYMADGKIKSSLNGSRDHICDVQSHLIVRRILEEVLTGLIESTVFKPE